jgi:hypothetical protein
MHSEELAPPVIGHSNSFSALLELLDRQRCAPRAYL